MKNKLSHIWLTMACCAGILIPLEASASTEKDWSLSNSLTTSATDATTKYAVNASRCRSMFDLNSGEISFLFTLDPNATVSNDAVYSIKFAKGNESCTKKIETDPGDSCLTIAENQKLTLSSSPIEVKRAVSTLSSAENANGCENLNESSYIYLVISDPNNGFENLYTVTYTLDFRTTRPKAPSGLSASAGGESIKVNWDSVSDASSYKIYYGTEGVSMSTGDVPENITNVHTATASSNSITIKDNVSADTTYLISITAIDTNGNESLLGEVVTVETVASQSFWDSYREENADVDGGFCFIATAAYGSTQEPHVAILRQFRDDILMQTAPGRLFVDTYYKMSPPMAYFIGQHPTLRAATRTALWPLYGMAWVLLNMPALFWGFLGLCAFAIAFFGIRRSRRRALAKTAAPIVAAALASSAFIAAPNEAYADSPVNMMAEFKAGPYSPDNLGDAFGKHFGDKSGFIVEGEYDWQFWRGVGSLGLGFHLAYGNIKGSALEKTGSESVDSTELHWLPLRLSLVYRFDYLWTRFEFPFTIYVKAGFDYAFWWVRDGADNIAQDSNGKKGYGGTFGFHAVAGIAFVLDWLAPDMEKAFDVEWGINNSYIFAEYMYCQLDNFGASGAFDLTDKATFHIGIGLEF